MAQTGKGALGLVDNVARGTIGIETADYIVDVSSVLAVAAWTLAVTLGGQRLVEGHKAGR